MLKDYAIMAIKNLRRRGIRSWLTLIGIFIGITAVVALISLGNGLQAAVNAQFGISATNVISVQAGGVTGFGPPGTGVVNPLTKDDAKAISNLNNVENAIPRNIESVKVEFNNKLIIGVAGSLPDNKKERDIVYETLQIETEFGKLIEESDSNKILIGNNFLDKTKSGFDKSLRVGDKIIIQDRIFEVKGIIEKKGSFIFDNVIMMKDSELESLTNYGEDADVIAVIIKDKDLIEKTKSDIEDLLRKRRDVKIGNEDFEVSTPQGLLDNVNQIILGVQIFIVLIASISIVVGSIGIVNTMTTSVLERKKEIGVMKAIGARNKDIFYQFFIEAGLLGLVGGIAGILAGTAIGYVGTSALNSFLGIITRPDINLILIISSLAGSFMIGAISGVIPALRAAHLNPVEALRS